MPTSASRIRRRVVFPAGTLFPEREGRVERQLLLKVGDDVGDSPPVTLSAELQEELVRLMAEMIAVALAQDGGNDE